ncbi:hypothetical protein B0T24DRAFT_530906 [Lasiosphaeria ovina]|uniref:non-specific serine/threonine protein kinase n=1 Tax=Lasiosphaeria ovina TaxID=92902 RepID=A0AAE0N6U2_9PEZI|nr:hypothetical protein B0T24DRAFT_530906 [Lasiosphaeria ovina]
MEPQHPQPRPRPSFPHLQNITLPPAPSQPGQRTANSTPVSSPGLFSPSLSRSNMSFPASQPASESTTPAVLNSPFLHPLQTHKVRETHKANVEHDYTTGRKLINHYEIIEELGRGMHGKVKLARNLETGENVAIKIIPRFSKRRRLGKVTAMDTQDKSKREIAILKKIRHPNVVALLEIIDDPELKKIYIALEHVELGEIIWRKKGLPHICSYERRRVEREMRGEKATPEEERYDRILEQRQQVKEAKRAKISQGQVGSTNDYWSLEYGGTDDDDYESQSRSLGRDEADALSASMEPTTDTATGSRVASRAPSRTHSTRSISRAAFSHTPNSDFGLVPNEDDLETPSALRSNPNSSSALDGTMYGAYVDDPTLRGRSPSMADSIISHMSSLDFSRVHDPYVDDFSYVPCFTLEKARQTFRDTVSGLEYLHYEGVVHRDIKPANLLWTKDHRVKISDFGVSYFGRPVRDGEPDDTVSESEAKDFDNDLELAKTVGTPAFFAPELCYTDAYDDQPGQQPKITEQIDVWSLGVTLYCLIFARIPFLAEDEWQMFRKIATEDVYIPTKRLRPVDPSTKPDEKSLYQRVNSAPYRDDDELAYEDIDKDLRDLLFKMLTKNPEKRIRLRDVKRHPWVTKGISNVVAWLDETDPSRRTSGRKIQVDEREVARAVVPLTLLERARSAVKKVVGKVIHPRGDRAESVSSRRRAGSSAASSAGDSPIHGPSTPHPRDARRRSIRPDDIFSSLSQASSEHPLTQSVVASPLDSSFEEASASSSAQPLSASSTGGPSSRQLLDLVTSLNTREESPNRSPHGFQRMSPRHGQTRSVTNAFLSLTPNPSESQTMPATPLFDGPADDPSTALRKGRDMRPPGADDSTRSRSVDRGLFASNDKRAEPKVSLSTAVAPGNVHFSPRPRPLRSSEIMKEFESSALAMSSKSLPGYQYEQRAATDREERPVTAHRVKEQARPPTPQQFWPNPSRPSSFLRRQAPEGLSRADTPPDVDAARIPCPPSPSDDVFVARPSLPSREETMATAVSSSSTSMGGLTTPLTSSSESTSPIYVINPITSKEADHILAFQSDPSLPALLSSTSSVSADLEGEFLGNPGIVGRSSVIDTTDSLTPPAFAKEPVAGFPLEDEPGLDDVVTVELDHRAGAKSAPSLATSHSAAPRSQADGDDESDSDEGLLMAKSKKHAFSRERHSMGRLAGSTRRRDTNASVGSTETAKKLVVDSD